jgi:4-hydroxy-3-methylbut-2-enyl diphosphate reductase
MKVIRAKVLGFCMGVRRAKELAFAEAQQAGGARVFTLGPLVHNPKVLADLKEREVETLDEIPSACDLKSCSVIIRAHGISAAIEKDLREKGFRVVDATCPKVKASQLKAQELSRAGYCLFLAGEAHHAEVEGVMSYAQAGSTPFCVVVSGASEAEKEAAKLFEKDKNAETALLGQTTICEDEYSQTGEAVKKYFPNLEVVQTICSAATERQKALGELLLKTDAVIIAGGKESANTRRLLSIAKESGKPCTLVENAGEIPPVFFTYGTVGLSAGASTPDSVIDEIETELLRGA